MAEARMMASNLITINVTEWPEMIHAIRRELVKLILDEAEHVSPEAAASLHTVAMKFDAGVTNMAKAFPDEESQT